MTDEQINPGPEDADELPVPDIDATDADPADDGLAPDEEAWPEDDGSGEPEDLFSPANLDQDERVALLAAVLFSAGEIVSVERLAEYFAIDPVELDVLAAETSGSLRPLGLDIMAAAGGFKLVTTGNWDSYLRNFHRKVRKTRLSKSALEILAVIAYEQPVTRARVDELRQVNSEGPIRTLLDKRIITVAGRADTPGRPFLYRTTNYFLELFGLDSLEDLPPRPVSLEKATGLGIGRSDEDDGPPGLDELPSFDSDMVETDELED